MLFVDMLLTESVNTRSIGVKLILGKAVRTSSQAGLTRTISNVIKVVDDPPIYMSDSPGNYSLRAIEADR